MKVAILGTRGIPNEYGGFERFAEVLSARLALRGVNVYVFSQVSKSSAAYMYGNVWVVPIAVPSFVPSNIQTLLYDFLSLVKAKRMGQHLVLECGYSFAPWLFLFKKRFRKRVIVNMDGLEYSREKWGFMARLFLRFSEYCAVNLCPNLIVDSRAIGTILYQKYAVSSVYIPYGANICSHSNIPINVPDGYCLAIARITPENSIRIMAEAAIIAKFPLVIVGNVESGYGKEMYQHYSCSEYIHFYGATYCQEELNALRLRSHLYVHGHTVGGTNPSLLEAMACGCAIVAHSNAFNREVLGDAGFYFSNEFELAQLIKKSISHNDFFPKQRVAIRNIVNENYNWEKISDDYFHLLEKVYGD